MENMREKKITSELIFNGKVVKLERDKVLCPNGNESFREVIRHNGGACVLGITKDDCVILEQQYRYTYDEVLFELPAGKLELNEDPLETAKREFEEETGYMANSIELLGIDYPTCGYSSEKIYMYFTDDFCKTKNNLDEDEVIILHEIPLKEVLVMIKDGRIKDGKTINAIMLYLLKKNKIVL